MAKAATELRTVAQPAGTASSHTWKSIQPPVDLGTITESMTSFPVETHRTLTTADAVVGINLHT